MSDRSSSIRVIATSAAEATRASSSAVISTSSRIDRTVPVASETDKILDLEPFSIGNIGLYFVFDAETLLLAMESDGRDWCPAIAEIVRP